VVSFFQGSNQWNFSKHLFSLSNIMYPPSIAYCTQLFTSSHHVSRELITYSLCTCSLLFTQENLFLFSDRVLEENIWMRREEVIRGWRSFIICTPRQTLLGWSNDEENESNRTCNVTGKEQICKYVWSEVLKVRDSFKHIVIDGKIILKWGTGDELGMNLFLS
jgi:hypothetical protein